MLGLLFIYFLGKYFYELADHNGRSAWAYAVLGIVFYYGSTFILGVVTVVLVGMFLPDALDNITDFQLSIMTIPFGLLFTYLLYLYLKRRFSNTSKRMVHTDSDILDDEFLQ